MVRKVVMNLDLSRASGPDCIPVVVLKNCEPELSYILAELFNRCLKCLKDYVINESFMGQLAEEKHVTLFKFGSKTNIYELKQAAK